MRPPASAAPIITKPNSPPGPSNSAISAAAPERQAETASEPEKRQRLDRDERRGEAENEAGPGGDERRIDRGPDRNEIEPEQEAPERFDRHFDLAAIFGLRQQEPGDEARRAPSTDGSRRRRARRREPPAGRPP